MQTIAVDAQLIAGYISDQRLIRTETDIRRKNTQRNAFTLQNAAYYPYGSECPISRNSKLRTGYCDSLNIAVLLGDDL
jgi:hypothetical protein